MKYFLILIIIFSFKSVSGTNVCSKEKECYSLPNISIIQLLSNPDKYHGQRIALTGYTTFEFEGSSVYLSKESFEYGITKNAIWLDFNKVTDSYPECNGTICSVFGVFNKNNFGHLGLWSGGITDINRMMLKEKR